LDIDHPCGRHPRGHPPSVGYPAWIAHRSSPILALVERLSRLDSQAEGALRVVVTFYDTLVRRPDRSTGTVIIATTARRSRSAATTSGGTASPEGAARIVMPRMRATL
jgi:hypothetical protein